MKISKIILTPIDWTALIIAILGLFTLVSGIFYTILFYIWRAIKLIVMEVIKMWDQGGSDRNVLIVFLVALGWCAIRWKALNKRPD